MSQTDHHTLETFRARFKHAPDDDVLVQGALDEAAARVVADDWGELTLAGHGYLTAHLLAMDVSGQDARLESDDGQTTYGVLFERLERVVGAAVAPRST